MARVCPPSAHLGLRPGSLCFTQLSSSVMSPPCALLTRMSPNRALFAHVLFPGPEHTAPHEPGTGSHQRELALELSTSKGAA